MPRRENLATEKLVKSTVHRDGFDRIRFTRKAFITEGGSEVCRKICRVRRWQFVSKKPTTVRDGAVTLKGPHSMGDRRLKKLKSPRLTL
jgi:hypothetical protein